MRPRVGRLPRAAAASENGLQLTTVLEDVIVSLMGRGRAAREEVAIADVRRPAEDRLVGMMDQGLDRAFRLAGLINGEA